MRVAFAGASGTGKSTLAKHVAEKYGLPMCPVGARSVAAEMGFASPYDVDKAGLRTEFQRRVFESKRAWEAEHEDFVTDRTVLDNLAYMICDGDPRTLRPGEVRQYMDACERYDFVFVTRPQQFQDLSDPVREKSAGYHEAFDYILFGMVEIVKASWVIPHAAVADRILFVNEVLRRVWEQEGNVTAR